MKEKTQIITSIKNELTKFDFSISSDSDIEQPKNFNPAHSRLNDKINELKEKVVLRLGREKYGGFIENVVEAIAEKSTLSKKGIEERLGK